MKILFILLGLSAFFAAYVYFSKEISCSFGHNLGNKHMKEQWGIDMQEK